jgi:multidrug efflux pump subunit AcrB
VTVSADVDRARNNPDSVAASVEAGFPAIEAEHPGVRIRKSGRQQDNAESFATLPVGAAVAAGLIYITLAWLFGSFTQPLIVMMAIPFAVIGMILGHLILGYSMTFLSLIGFVALAGIVVNDSLVYMQFFNAQRRRGQSVLDAALAAGRARVRAIILTTVTTVAGLAPLILEQSLQARFLIPMAITIAAGLISATLLVLIVLPCMLRIFDDISHTARVLWSGDLSLPRRNPFLADAELELLDAPSPDARNTDAPAAARPAPHA